MHKFVSTFYLVARIATLYSVLVHSLGDEGNIVLLRFVSKKYLTFTCFVLGLIFVLVVCLFCCI
jgi:hypothetical protein